MTPATTSAPRPPNSVDRVLLRNRTNVYVLGLSMLFLLFWIYPHCFHYVPAGHSAVLWKRFDAGTQLDRVYLEGLHVTAPWDILTTYETRVQHHQAQFTVISSNGLSLDVTVTMRFRPKKELLPQLHVNVGPEYYDKIVLPEVQSLIRLVFGQYEPAELYTSKRNVIENSLASAMGEISERYVVLDDLLIEAITLPPSIRDAIEIKLQEEQHYLAMEYRLKREEQEAERKDIEAGGIQRYQQKVSETLTPLLLQYRGVDAMMELSRSPNAKFVIAGGGEGGVPLILNTETPGYADPYKPLPRTGTTTVSSAKGIPAVATNAQPTVPDTRTNTFKAAPAWKDTSWTNLLKLPEPEVD